MSDRMRWVYMAGWRRGTCNQSDKCPYTDRAWWTHRHLQVWKQAYQSGTNSRLRAERKARKAG